MIKTKLALGLIMLIPTFIFAQSEIIHDAEYNYLVEGFTILRGMILATMIILTVSSNKKTLMTKISNC